MAIREIRIDDYYIDEAYLDRKLPVVTDHGYIALRDDIKTNGLQRVFSVKNVRGTWVVDGDGGRRALALKELRSTHPDKFNYIKVNISQYLTVEKVRDLVADASQYTYDELYSAQIDTLTAFVEHIADNSSDGSLRNLAKEVLKVNEIDCE